MDIALALVLAPPALVVCMALGLLIMSVDRSPAIFVQKRIGRNGKSFALYKLRTMRTNSPDLPTHEASASLVTPLGTFLRRKKLDELPQLVNVLRGDMSFVGPRPCLPSQTELLVRREALGVLSLRPGITGVSQLAGLDMSRPTELAELDATYVEGWSLRKDLRIISQTILGGGAGDAVRFGNGAEDADPGHDR
ncbi:sugar transferase [Leptolyngbya sp. 15MV]|nr:sugar transferase [Leptolyngbya sp. 15MV]